MAENTSLDFNVGGSIFWGIMILLSVFSLVYISIWAFHADSVKGVAIAAIFFMMIASGILLSRLKVFDLGTWSSNCVSFLIGFLIWIFVGGSSKSIFAVSQNNLFASIASELPQFMEFTMNSFLIPIAEEIFWLIGLPFVVIAIMRKIADTTDFDLFDNEWIQIIIAALISGVTFAIFHVGKLEWMFLFAAFVFRVIIIIAVYADLMLDVWPMLRLAIAFGLGSHIGNNLADYGLGAAFVQLNSNFFPVGLLVYLLFAVIIGTTINAIVLKVYNKTSEIGGS